MIGSKWALNVCIYVSQCGKFNNIISVSNPYTYIQVHTHEENNIISI